MGEFHKLELEPHRLQTAASEPTAESRYWKKLKWPIVETFSAPCTHVEFSPAAPRTLAVSSSMAISIFRGIGSAIGVPAQALPKPKSASKFRDIAYCGTFRSDGKLLAAGDATGKVTVFEAATATLLRELAGHKDATRVVAWAADNMHLLSGSDDCSLRYWDLPTQKSLLVQKGAHADFVRAAAQSPASDETWLTGGYDRKVRLWDVRVPRTGDDGGERRCNALMEMDHGSPVEATLFLPGGGIALSAGGDVIKVWDVLAGGRELHSLSHHSRAITSLVLDGTRTRLISGGLDGHVKMYSLSTFAPTHSIKYAAPVIALAASAENNLLAVAMANQTLSVRQRDGTKREKQPRPDDDPHRPKLEPAPPPGGTFRFFERGKRAAPAADDHVVEHQRKQRLQPYERALRRFKYREALDEALETRSPVVVVSVLRDLTHRQGLAAAISGRDEASLEPLLAFLARYTTSPRYASLLCEVCHVVLDLYAHALGQSEPIDELLMKLHRQLNAEVILHREMFAVRGLLETVSARAVATESR